MYSCQDVVNLHIVLNMSTSPSFKFENFKLRSFRYVKISIKRFKPRIHLTNSLFGEGGSNWLSVSRMDACRLRGASGRARGRERDEERLHRRTQYVISKPTVSNSSFGQQSSHHESRVPVLELRNLTYDFVKGILIS